MSMTMMARAAMPIRKPRLAVRMLRRRRMGIRFNGEWVGGSGERLDIRMKDAVVFGNIAEKFGCTVEYLVLP